METFHLNRVAFWITFQVVLHIKKMCANHLSRGIATVGKDGLPGNPAALVAEEANKRRNVRDFSQSAAQALALVECNCFIRLLWVEKCYH